MKVLDRVSETTMRAFATGEQKLREDQAALSQADPQQDE
jgi:hypothetical protein